MQLGVQRAMLAAVEAYLMLAGQFVKFIYAANPLISKHQRARLTHVFPRHGVPYHRCSQAG